MTYEMLEGLLERLSSAICQAAKSMEMVHVTMMNMRHEGRKELNKEEWDQLRPMLELTRYMVSKEAAKRAVEARELVRGKLGAPGEGVLPGALDKAVEDHFVRAIKDAGGYVSDKTAKLMIESFDSNEENLS